MDHTNFPIATPIPLDVFNAFEAQVDWDEYYGRFGTETLIYSDFYNSQVPTHLAGKVTHVWMYFEK
jgi:hypothetical protein